MLRFFAPGNDQDPVATYPVESVFGWVNATYFSAEVRRRDLKSPEDVVKVLLRVPSETGLEHYVLWGAGIEPGEIDGLHILSMSADPPIPATIAIATFVAEWAQGRSWTESASEGWPILTT
jgi:hypothetical protein